MTDRDPETILNMWAEGKTADQICDATFYSRDAVFFHLRKARRYGDPRAARRECQAPARRRAIKIRILDSIGIPPEHIAAMVGVTKRMVQIRLKEFG